MDLVPRPPLEWWASRSSGLGEGPQNCQGTKGRALEDPRQCREQAPLGEKSTAGILIFRGFFHEARRSVFNSLLMKERTLVIRRRRSETGAHDVVEELRRMQK